MQSMSSSLPEATTSPVFTLSSGHLLAAFARVPDPRRAHGKRFWLRAIFALAMVALISNHLSVLAIAQWGKRQSPADLAALGFPDGVTPHQTTVQRLFRTLDPLPLAAVLTAYFAPASSRNARCVAARGWLRWQSAAGSPRLCRPAGISRAYAQCGRA